MSMNKRNSLIDMNKNKFTLGAILSVVLISISATLLATIVGMHYLVYRSVPTYQELEIAHTSATNQCAYLENKIQELNKARNILMQDLVRERRVSGMVAAKARTKMVQKQGVKIKYATFPPDMSLFDPYEVSIKLTPKPHFVEHKITVERWNKIWMCTCPMTCDTWIGEMCSCHKCSVCKESHDK